MVSLSVYPPRAPFLSLMFGFFEMFAIGFFMRWCGGVVWYVVVVFWGGGVYKGERGVQCMRWKVWRLDLGSWARGRGGWRGDAGFIHGRLSDSGGVGSLRSGLSVTAPGIVTGSEWKPGSHRYGGAR